MTCQRCTACEGQEHHWMPEPEHDLGMDVLYYECKHCPAQCDADSTSEGWTPGAMRRVLALAPGEQMAEFCAGCGQLVDHETCGCGVDRAQHNQDVLGHAFVSDGCRCLDVEYTDAKELVALRRLLLVAHEERPLAVHPRDVVPSAPTRYRPRERHLSAHDFGRLLAAAPDHRRLWLMVAAYTGACLGELERLEWQHVDLRRGVITIPGTKRETRYRTIPLSGELAPWLAGAAGRRGPILGRWGNVRRDLALYCERARIEVVTPNDLRRTYASWLVDAGVPTHTVATLLGHSSSRMVERVYGRLGIDHLAAAVAQLPRCDAGVTSPVPSVSRSALPVAVAGAANISGSLQVFVPRDGVEPPTRGFSVRVIKGGKR